MSLMKPQFIRQALAVVVASALTAASAHAQVRVPKLSPDVRDCRFILVGAERTPVPQYLRLSLLARDGDTEEKLSGKQRKAADIILTEWREQLILSHPRAFTDTVIFVKQWLPEIAAQEKKSKPDTVVKLVPNVVSGVTASLLANGQVLSAVVKDTSQWPDADSTLRFTLLRHVPSTAFATAARALTKDSIRIRVQTSVRAGPDPTGAHVDLQILQLPLFVGTPVTIHRDNRGGPPYPEEMRRKGMTGTVLVNFYVSATGQAEEETLKVLRATDGRFVESVRQAISGILFIPASVNGCAVRQLVQQSFVFNLRR